MSSSENIENKVEIIETSDGSSSLYLPSLDETYHSRHGAVQEALHVFIEMGLVPCLNKFEDLRIFEMGFGTGLNALLSILNSDNSKNKIYYDGLEKTPIPIELANQLTYRDLSIEYFNKIHAGVWNENVKINEHFTLQKISGDILKIDLGSENYNLVYFDAFGPRAQGEMWDISIFEKIYLSMVKEGLFVTYCAKGQVRRDLESVGFSVERLPGPPGKREMLRATKL